MNGSGGGSLSQIGGLFADLFDTQFRLGLRLLETMADGPARRTLETLERSGVTPTRGCCHIPPPCWVPVDLGIHTSRVCPGMAASIAICVTNCDQRPSTITATATGPDAGHVSISPTALVLGPKERGCIHFTFQAAKPGESPDREAILWVRGCKEYCLRWRIRRGDVADCRTPKFEVDDCPDLLHHWYDHFYCRRPCFGRRTGSITDVRG